MRSKLAYGRVRQMLGDELVDRYRIVQHDAWDDGNLAHVPCGVGDSVGTPCRASQVPFGYLRSRACLRRL
jgi:hypothetical protein